MAVNYSPGGEHHPDARLISSGGNIYSTAVMPVKTGYATRGRGFWVGKKRADQANPNVDDPDDEGAEELLAPDEEDEEKDGFDDADPFAAFYQKAKAKEFGLAQQRQAAVLAEAVMGPVRKAVLTLGSVKVDLLLQNPEELTEAQLVKSAGTVQSLLSQNLSGVERGALTEYAGRLAHAMRNLVEARETLTAKAFPKAKEEKVKPSHQSKASEKKADSKGKTQYKYQKKGNGKGVNSDGARQGDKPGVPKQHSEAQPQPPPQIDPAPFAAKLGLAPAQLESFAKKKTKQQFVEWFTKRPELMTKLQLQAAFLAKLYDSIINPPPPPQQSPQPKMGAQPGTPNQMMQQMGAQAVEQMSQLGQKMPGKKPGQAGKSMLVVFNGATLDRGTRGLIDLCKSHEASTVEDIRKVLQTHYAVTEDESVRVTRSLLTKWQREGLVAFYPGG